MISVILWFMLLITAVLTVILFHQSVIPFSRNHDFKGIFFNNLLFRSLSWHGLQVIENSLLFDKLWNHYPANEKHVSPIRAAENKVTRLEARISLWYRGRQAGHMRR